MREGARGQGELVISFPSISSCTLDRILMHLESHLDQLVSLLDLAVPVLWRSKGACVATLGMPFAFLWRWSSRDRILFVGLCRGLKAELSDLPEAFVGPSVHPDEGRAVN
jgi:hypothetical protein